MPEAVETTGGTEERNTGSGTGAAPGDTSDPAALEAERHLASLHKMSTTAGITDGGYVAVNLTSVVALLLGLASALAFSSAILLLVPLLAIGCALLAVRQIRNSNGTQTGVPLAYLGIALSVLLGGGAVAALVMNYMAVSPEARQVGQTLGDVGRLVIDQKYEQAYQRFDHNFQERVPFDTFKGTWEAMRNSKTAGGLEIMEWNGVTPEFTQAEGNPVAATKLRIKFRNFGEDRADVILIKVGPTWYINNIPQWFPQKPPRRGPRDPMEIFQW